MTRAASANFAVVVDDPADVTPAWMSEALTRGGSPATVFGLNYERIGTGQTAACYRFRLQHDGSAPDTLILKTVAGDLEQRARVAGGYRAEVTFYKTFASLTQIRTPRCYYAALAEEGPGFTILLEDAAPATAGRQEVGCTLDQAAAAIRNLAGLHGPLWDDPALERAAWLVMEPPRAARIAEAHVAATDMLIARCGDALPAREADLLRRVTAFTGAFLMGDDHPRVLLHGDYRLDNLLFAPDGAVLAVDWQTISLGAPGRDVAYFLTTALSREARKAHETELLGVYHDQLQTYGVTGYSLDDCRTDYRRGMLQTPFITTLGAMTATGERSDASDAMFLSMARHAAQALEDLEVIEFWEAGSPQRGNHQVDDKD